MSEYPTGLITCKNCQHHFYGKFCNECGEKVYTNHDRSIGHFFEEGIHFITHLDGTLLTTIKAMVVSPGRPSLDYCDGIRKRYFKPFTFFLLLVVLYLLFPYFEGLNMRMQYHTDNSFYGNYAATRIAERMQQTGLSEADLAEKFHIKSEKTSKFLLISLIPLTALVFYAVSFLKRKYFFDHLIFASEINGAFLLWGFLITPVIMILLNLFIKLVTGSYMVFGDAVLGIIIYAGLLLYTFVAAMRFYAFKWWQSLLFTIVFYIGHSFIVFTLYKFLLFVIVISQTH